MECCGPSCLLFVRRGHVFLVPSSARLCPVKVPGYSSMMVIFKLYNTVGVFTYTSRYGEILKESEA